MKNSKLKKIRSLFLLVIVETSQQLKTKGKKIIKRWFLPVMLSIKNNQSLVLIKQLSRGLGDTSKGHKVNKNQEIRDIIIVEYCLKRQYYKQIGLKHQKVKGRKFVTKKKWMISQNAELV